MNPGIWKVGATTFQPYFDPNFTKLYFKMFFIEIFDYESSILIFNNMQEGFLC